MGGPSNSIQNHKIDQKQEDKITVIVVVSIIAFLAITVLIWAIIRDHEILVDKWNKSIPKINSELILLKNEINEIQKWKNEELTLLRKEIQELKDDECKKWKKQIKYN